MLAPPLLAAPLFFLLTKLSLVVSLKNTHAPRKTPAPALPRALLLGHTNTTFLPSPLGSTSVD